MPATRLLVLADPKMLSALANGLREGARFDVLTLPFGDPGAAAAAQRADAVAIFYGSPDKSLPSLVQELGPPVRSRGGRVVAVLQRDQVAQRDECFRAGASDVLFMPLPKEQFVSRLAAAVALSYAADAGIPAPVQIGARGNLVPLAQAAVTPAGVHAAAALPFQPGETVRVSWARFECWGLVARSSPDAQVRFAGLAPDEETRIREWAHKGAPPGPGAAKPEATASAGAGAAPQAGPKPSAQPGPAAPVAAGANPPRPAAAPAASPPAANKPPWPTVPDVDACRDAGMAVLRDKKAPAGVSPELAASAKKVVEVMNVGERTALEKAGAGSHFGAALAAHVVLELARVELTQLIAAQSLPAVDDAAVKAVSQVVAAATARLQKEVEVAIGRADVDTLQLLTVANAALSRDFGVFKDVADRLAGKSAAPRPGANAVDPNVGVPAQMPRFARRTADRPAVKPELSEFAGLGEQRAPSRRKALLLVCLLAGAVSLTHLMFFAYPRINRVWTAIPGIAQVEVSGNVARVTISDDFAGHEANAIAMLAQVLRERGVERALLVRRNGGTIGQLAVKDGKVSALAVPAKNGPQAVPAVTPGTTENAQEPAQSASAQSQ